MIALLILAETSAGLSPLMPLVGHCWRGTLPDGGVDTHCFTSTDRQHTIVDRHLVRKRGKPVYRGETRYMVTNNAIRWEYRNASGPVMAGGLSAAAGELRFTVDGGSTLTWRWQGNRAYISPTGPTAAPIMFRRVR